MEQLNLVPPVHRLKIVPDSDPMNPRKEWDNLGTMVCWHNNYDLGDEQPNADSREYLLDLAETYAPGISERIERWHDSRPYWNNDTERREYYRQADAYFDKQVDAVLAKHYIMLPLYLYDHSGITMRTGAFSCPWDSGQVGFIYVSRERVLKEYNWKVLTAKRRAQIASYLEGEVETYDHYLTGQVYGFVVEQHDGTTGDWEEVDACWGFYGDDAEGVHCHVDHFGFTLDQVKQAYADPWYDGADGTWAYSHESKSK